MSYEIPQSVLNNMGYYRISDTLGIRFLIHDDITNPLSMADVSHCVIYPYWGNAEIVVYQQEGEDEFIKEVRETIDVLIEMMRFAEKYSSTNLADMVSVVDRARR